MATLTFFTATGIYYAAAADGSYDVGVDPDLVPVTGTVTFTPLVNAGDSLQADTLVPPTNLLLTPITARIKSGQIWLNGAPGARLVAKTDVLNLTGNLFYRVDFTDLVARGKTQTLKSFNFQAPTTDTVIDLVDVTPVPGTSAGGVTRGPAGDPGKPVDNVAKVGSSPDLIQFYVDGTPIGSPLPLVVTAGSITSADITDATTVGKAVLIAANAAAARAAIGAGTSSLVIGTTAGTAAEGNDSRLSDTRTPTDGSVTAAKLAANAVTTAKILDANVTTAKIADANVTTGKIADVNVTKPKLSTAVQTSLDLADSSVQSIPDATTGAKGIVKLAGDLAGTAALPTVAKVNGVAVTGTPSAGMVPTATSGSAASWQTPSSGGMADPTTTKGDLIVRGASSTVRQAIGTNGQVLTADSTQSNGLKWATPAGGGGSMPNFDFYHNWLTDGGTAPTTSDSGHTFTNSFVGATGAPAVSGGRFVINGTSGNIAGYVTANPNGSNTVLYTEAEFEFSASGTDGQFATIVLWQSALPSGSLSSASDRAYCHLRLGTTGMWYETYVSPALGGVGAEQVGSAVTYSGYAPGTKKQKVCVAIDPYNNRAVVRAPDGQIYVFTDVVNNRISGLTCPYMTQEIFYTNSATDKRVLFRSGQASAVIGDANQETLSKYELLLALGDIDGAGGTGASVQYIAAPSGSAATDTAAIQAAHDALPSSGGEIRLQAGLYLITSTGVTFTKKVRMVGVGGSGMDGQGLTVLYGTSQNSTFVTINKEGCILEDFSLVNGYTTAAHTSGAGIRLIKAHQAKLNRLFVYNFYDNISVEAGHYWSLKDSIIYGPSRYGLYVRNSDHDDSGDQLVSGNWFDCGGALRNGVSAVRWETGSGLRLISNKVNGGSFKFATGFDISPTMASNNAADIFIQNNSLENITTTCIKLARSSGSLSVLGTMVQGNEFLSTPTAVSVGVGFSHTLIQGNIGCGHTTGISLLSGATSTTVGANRWLRAVTQCVQIASGVSADTKVAVQHVDGDGLVIVDNSGGGTTTAQVDYGYKRAVDWTVNGTPHEMWTLGLPNNCGGLVTVTITGNHNGTGGFAASRKFGYTVNNSGVVALTDVEVIAHGSTGPTITLTGATNAVALKLSTSDAQSILSGVAAVDVMGYLTTFKVGA